MSTSTSTQNTKPIKSTRGPLLLPYQQRWHQDVAPVALWEKSRRVGASWCDAADSVLLASKATGMDALYIGYNEDMTREYIEDCAQWAKSFQIAAETINESLFDTRDAIKAYRIDFSSGHKILALTSRPRNLRGKQGKIIIDEAAFHDDLPGLLKASMSMLIWGGRVRLISTHNGETNYFNSLINETRRGEHKFSLHRTTFDDAINDGLFERICEIRDVEPTLESKEKWIEDIRNFHGSYASEELDCVAASDKGAYFTKSWFETVEAIPQSSEIIRYWDRAGTAPSRENPSPDWTVGVKMHRCDSTYYISDVIRFRDSPGGVQKKIYNTSSQDGRLTKIGIEQDPGQAGKNDASLYVKLLAGYDVRTYPATQAKVVRARGLSAQAEAGNVKLLRAEWNDAFLDELSGFPGGMFDDQVDAASGAFNALAEMNLFTSELFW